MPRHWAERVARQHLEEKGYAFLAENWARPGGEIDLVMQDGETVVFIEVRQRRGERYGSAAESITPRKLARLRATALRYLLDTFGTNDVAVRFDAVLLEGTRTTHHLQHLQNIV